MKSGTVRSVHAGARLELVGPWPGLRECAPRPRANEPLWPLGNYIHDAYRIRRVADSVLQPLEKDRIFVSEGGEFLSRLLGDPNRR
jgi:hypothetical protein